MAAYDEFGNVTDQPAAGRSPWDEIDEASGFKGVKMVDPKNAESIASFMSVNNLNNVDRPETFDKAMNLIFETSDWRKLPGAEKFVGEQVIPAFHRNEDRIHKSDAGTMEDFLKAAGLLVAAVFLGPEVIGAGEAGAFTAEEIAAAAGSVGASAAEAEAINAALNAGTEIIGGAIAGDTIIPAEAVSRAAEFVAFDEPGLAGAGAADMAAPSVASADQFGDVVNQFLPQAAQNAGATAGPQTASKGLIDSLLETGKKAGNWLTEKPERALTLGTLGLTALGGVGAAEAARKRAEMEDKLAREAPEIKRQSDVNARANQWRIPQKGEPGYVPSWYDQILAARAAAQAKARTVAAPVVPQVPVPGIINNALTRV